MSDTTFAVPGVVTPNIDPVQAPPPPMYAVILLNDDFTPAEFVVELLIQVFFKKPMEAVNIMFEVHNAGKAVAGIYTRQIAETRVWQAVNTARNHNHPLQCIMEVV